MIIINGSYHWFPKTKAFRYDYCRTCEDDTVSMQIRTIDVFHMYWIPVFPWGIWSRWHCVRCGSSPHVNVKTRIELKIVGIIILALISFSFWSPELEVEMEALELWGCRLSLLVVLLIAIVWVFKHVPEPDFHKRLGDVNPYCGLMCLVCDGPLSSGVPSKCFTCGAKHLPLK